MRNYIEAMLEMPWKKGSKDNKDLKKASAILEEDHYGLEKVKERILDYLAVRSLTERERRRFSACGSSGNRKDIHRQVHCPGAE